MKKHNTINITLAIIISIFTISSAFASDSDKVKNQSITPESLDKDHSEELKELHNEIDRLNSSLTAIQIAQSVMQIKAENIANSSNHRLDSAINNMNTDTSTLYTILEIVLGIIGLLLAIGFVFVVRENHLAKRSMELLDNEVQNIITSINNKSKKISSEIEKIAATEILIFKTKLKLHEAIAMNDIDQDSIYDSVRKLDQHLDIANIPLLKRLLKLNLEDDVMREVVNSINNLKKLR